MDPVNSVKRILVIGGGVGGLTAGTALARRGFEVDLVEVKPEFTASGVGLGQPANALRALRAVGVLQECLDAGFQFDQLRFCDARGELIVAHRFQMGDEGVPAIAALPRAALHNILLAAAKKAGVRIRMGVTAREISQTDQVAHVDFTDGRSDEYDLVIGFDGIRSATRRMLFGDAHEPVYSGYAAWRLTVDRPDDVTCMQFYQGIGSKTGLMPLNKDKMYLFHIRSEPGNPWQNPATMHESLRERLGGYGGAVGRVRDALSSTSGVVYSPIELLMVPRPWHVGRVVVAGDAAHTFPPHLTQGAGMALEDGVVLAEELSKEGALSARLAAFMDRRFERCEFVQGFAGRMLLGEQTIRSEADLEAAKRHMYAALDADLASADQIMDSFELVGA
jgi:2-polyprenyl-6-methoxyphenol hydroxylase-like FAD-dependent oxidoreductase